MAIIFYLIHKYNCVNEVLCQVLCVYFLMFSQPIKSFQPFRLFNYPKLFRLSKTFWISENISTIQNYFNYFNYPKHFDWPKLFQLYWNSIKRSKLILTILTIQKSQNYFILTSCIITTNIIAYYIFFFLCKFLFKTFLCHTKLLNYMLYIHYY